MICQGIGLLLEILGHEHEKVQMELLSLLEFLVNLQFEVWYEA